MAPIDESTRVTVDEGVVFANGGGRDLLCDVYRPHPSVIAAQAFTPALVLTHGGAWRGGDRQQLSRYAYRYAREGWLCVAHEYRLTPEARWPHHVEDVKAAIRWTRANADALGIDPDRIAIQGNSAGAHLALVAAGAPDVFELEGSGGNNDVSSAVAACVAIYAPTRVRYQIESPATLALLTDEPSEWVAMSASPVTYARAEFPPTLLIHGDADVVVPVRASLEMHRALRAAGATVEMHIYANQPHAFDALPSFGQRTSAEIAFFLDRYVRADTPETAPLQVAQGAPTRMTIPLRTARGVSTEVPPDVFDAGIDEPRDVATFQTVADSRDRPRPMPLHLRSNETGDRL